jgi:hypothetical protein
MTQHPSSLDLEAFVVGEPLPAGFDGHVDDCSACNAFVAQLRGIVEAAPSRTAAEADAAVARALARMESAQRIEREQRAAETSETSETGAPSRVTRLAPKRRLWTVATSIVAPLAAAAAILVLARSSFSPPVAGRVPPPSPTTPAPALPDTLLMGTLPPGFREPDTQFKGGMQIAVVRERGGQQARFSSMVSVRPGDRLRVEVALDHEQAILGAVLADDGSYLELMPQAVRGPGTHFSERSAKIDAAPTQGTILIGSPEAVARARDARNARGAKDLPKDLPGVASLRVEWEKP